jgi:asparagine synthase (glutamine-hydrolysing)
VAAHLGTDHTELYVTAEDAMDVIPKLPVMCDEPFGDSSQIPTFLVSAMARRDVTVALSGDGGDELFGGYSRYRSMYRIWNQTSRLPTPLRKILARRIQTHEAFVSGDLGRAVRMLSAESFEALYRWKASRIENPARLVPEARGRASTDADPIAFLDDPRMKMMYWDALHFLPDNILTKVDRASMAVSLESRAPFLDTRVAEFAWRLPMSAKLSDRQGKTILRELLRRYLPTGAADRRKRGFAVPMASWLRGPLRGWAADLLSEDRLSRQGNLNVPAVAALWRNFLMGKPRHDRILWNLLSFQGWLDQLDAEISASPTIVRR